jgi:hypothetical protein
MAVRQVISASKGFTGSLSVFLRDHTGLRMRSLVGTDDGAEIIFGGEGMTI